MQAVAAAAQSGREEITAVCCLLHVRWALPLGRSFNHWDLNLNKGDILGAGWRAGRVSGLNNVSRKIFGSKAGMAVVG